MAPGDVTVVIHDNPAWLAGAHPLLPVVRWTAAPAARRYIAGWPMAGEIHVLSDEWMERRAAGEDSLRALLATAERMYAQLVLAANNDRVPPMWTPRRFLAYLQWAWLIEGAAQYFTGQVSLYRAAVITRLREGERPRFPPSRRDAILLGGTVFDLLDRHTGPQACALLASRLHRSGARGNLELAFDARMHEIEQAWRHHLDTILHPNTGGDPLHDAGDQGSPLGPAQALPAAAPAHRADRPARHRARRRRRARRGGAGRLRVRGPVRGRAADQARGRPALAHGRGAAEGARDRLRARARVRLRDLRRRRRRAAGRARSRSPRRRRSKARAAPATRPREVSPAAPRR